MNKQKVYEKIYLSSFISVEEFIKEVNNKLEEHQISSKDATIEFEYDYESASLCLAFSREETDEEFQIRLSRIAAAKERRKAQYLQLKEEFENESENNPS